MFYKVLKRVGLMALSEENLLLGLRAKLTFHHH
jgi:hypothetical protein